MVEKEQDLSYLVTWIGQQEGPVPFPFFHLTWVDPLWMAKEEEPSSVEIIVGKESNQLENILRCGCDPTKGLGRKSGGGGRETNKDGGRSTT